MLFRSHKQEPSSTYDLIQRCRSSSTYMVIYVFQTCLAGSIVGVFSKALKIPEDKRYFLWRFDPQAPRTDLPLSSIVGPLRVHTNRQTFPHNV